MSHRLGVATASALLMVAVGGCATERDLGTHALGRFEVLPEDAVRVGDRWVRSASLEGEIAGEVFDGQARVQAFESDYGHVAVELALPTERGAVMTQDANPQEDVNAPQD